MNNTDGDTTNLKATSFEVWRNRGSGVKLYWIVHIVDSKVEYACGPEDVYGISMAIQYLERNEDMSPSSVGYACLVLNSRVAKSLVEYLTNNIDKYELVWSKMICDE